MAIDSSKGHIETAVFANGCFWCTEAVFSMLRGVASVVPGYAAGPELARAKPKAPTYDDVCNGDSGYAEAIRIEYDPAIISFADLLVVFFNTHDPTTLNRQGPDIGEQYRSAIFYADDAQRTSAEATISDLVVSKAYDKPIVTSVEPLGAFYEAEDYHKEYYERHKDQPYCELVIAPKVEKMQKRFAELLKAQ